MENTCYRQNCRTSYKISHKKWGIKLKPTCVRFLIRKEVRSMRKILNIFYFLILFIAVPSFAGDKYLTDNQVRKQMIEESIASYSGNCPCPYNLARNGSRCGRRSAYSRRGGYSPLCYPSDISSAMVQDYRKQHGILKSRE